jgi:multidrug efflux pump subunit AcrB
VESPIGHAQITLQFELSRNVDAAAHDGRAAIGRSLSQLPANIPSPPSYRKLEVSTRKPHHHAFLSQVIIKLPASVTILTDVGCSGICCD